MSRLSWQSGMSQRIWIDGVIGGKPPRYRFTLPPKLGQTPHLGT
jgi:hypothetical protein